jgi:hypothetical protein
MTNTKSKIAVGFYFSLPRLLSKVTGRDSDFSEGSFFETCLGSLVVLLIPYFFLVDLVMNHVGRWMAFGTGVALLFAIWIFWLVVLYLNWVMIEVLHGLGFFRGVTERHLQDILVGLIITFFASELSILNSWVRWIGILWLIILAMNLAATLSLALTNTTRGR